MTTEFSSNELCSDDISNLPDVNLDSELVDRRITVLDDDPNVPVASKHNQDVSVLQLQLQQSTVTLQEEIHLQVIDKRLPNDYLTLPITTDVKYTVSYLCRLCASVVDLTSALTIFPSDEFQDDLASKINKYLPIVVYETDPLPKTVCKSCVTKLNDFHELTEKCMLVEEQLRRSYILDRRYIEELNKKVNQKSDLELFKNESVNNDQIYTMPELQYISALETLNPDKTGKEAAFQDAKNPTESLDQANPSENLEPVKVEITASQRIEDEFREVNFDLSPIICRFCSESLKDADECLQHLVRHDSEASNQFSCVLCEYLSNFKCERDSHIRTHFESPVETLKNNRPLTSREKTKARQQRQLKHKIKFYNKVLCCKKCKESLDNVDVAVEHCLKHKPAGIKSYPCVLCVKRIGISKLKEHLSLHYPMITKPILSCDNCNNLYPDEKTLKYHRCSKLRKFKCSQCKLGFKSEDRLKFHEDFHKNKSTFCDICKKDFKFESRIYLHFAGVHNGIRDKPYCCDVCGKTFTWFTVLISHKRTHTNERPFKCGKCEARFCDKYSLKGHMPSHEDHPQFYCDKCDYHTGRKENLQKHVSRFHKEIHSSQVCIKCKRCNEIFPNKDHVRVEQHASRHAEPNPEMILFSCDPPYQRNYPPEELFEELVVTKLYQCERCERCYMSAENLSQHRVKHSNDDPGLLYQCRLCDLGFSKHDLLVKHQKVHVNITSQYNSKLSVLIVISCDICGIECVDYRQLINHKDRGNCMMKKIRGTVRPKKVLIKKHLKPLKTHQLYVNSNGMFECPNCQRTYKNRRRYRLHLATHANFV